jgi:hypothetical protein
MKFWPFGKKELRVDLNNNNHEQSLRDELFALNESIKKGNIQGTKQRRIDEITTELNEIDMIKKTHAEIRRNNPNLFQGKGGYKKSNKRKSKRKSNKRTKSYKKRLTHS